MFFIATLYSVLSETIFIVHLPEPIYHDPMNKLEVDWS